MILVDGGPLIAIIDQGESDHESCVMALEQLKGPLATTWPAFTEAIYLLGEAGGWAAQNALWKLVDRRDLEIMGLKASQRRRTRALMEKYQDVPMDLADASLVALAESLDQDRVFTLDSDFRIYRIRGKRSFQIIP